MNCYKLQIIKKKLRHKVNEFLLENNKFIVDYYKEGELSSEILNN